MGTRILDGTHVSVTLFDGAGQPKGDPIETPFVAIHGTARNIVTGGHANLTPQERDLEGGSEDWLTLIAVADTKERLEQLVDTHKSGLDEAPLSSAASLRVRVRVATAARTEAWDGAITIADGVRHPDFRLDVQTILVLPSHAAIDARPDLKQKFDEMRPFGAGGTPQP